MCGVFLPHWPILWYQLGVLQFNSDTIYLELMLDPTSKVSVSQTAPTSNAKCNFQNSCNFNWPALNWGFPWPPPQDWFSRMAHKTQRNTHLHLPVHILKDMIKYTDEQVNRVRSGNFLGVICPCGVGMYHSPGTWKFSKHCTLFL